MKPSEWKLQDWLNTGHFLKSNSHSASDLESTDNILYLTACYTHWGKNNEEPSRDGSQG